MLIDYRASLYVFHSPKPLVTLYALLTPVKLQALKIIA